MCCSQERHLTNESKQKISILFPNREMHSLLPESVYHTYKFIIHARNHAIFIKPFSQPIRNLSDRLQKDYPHPRKDSRDRQPHRENLAAPQAAAKCQSRSVVLLAR
jgi:hypothetical protein